MNKYPRIVGFQCLYPALWTPPPGFYPVVRWDPNASSFATTRPEYWTLLTSLRQLEQTRTLSERCAEFVLEASEPTWNVVCRKGSTMRLRPPPMRSMYPPPPPPPPRPPPPPPRLPPPVRSHS